MKEKIREIFRCAGIKDIAFCEFERLTSHLIECRALGRIPQKSKTVIMCVFPYKVQTQEPDNISRYAAVPDYHNVCGEMLSRAARDLINTFPQNCFECFVDNSPIPEVFAAALAGLGVKGDNGLLITEKYGSYVFLGEIVTDLYIECENLYRECEHCGRCVKACPVGCEKLNCLSALSQKKGELSDEQITALKKHRILWGCDICAESCPLNENAQNTYIEAFIKGYRNSYRLGENAENRAYNWRKGAIERNFLLQNTYNSKNA